MQSISISSRNKVLAGVAAAAFLGPFTQTVYTPSLMQLREFFHVNTLLINLTISLFTAILAFSNFVVGPIADRWGRRATLLPGLIVFALGSLVCVAANSYGVFLAGRMVQATGISTALLIAPTVIGDIYAPNERGEAMSLYQTVNFLGPVLGPVIGGFMAGYLSWQWIFVLLCVGGMAMWFYNYRTLAETLPRDVKPTPVSLQAFAEVLRNRSAFAIITVGFSQFFGYYVFLVFLPTLLQALVKLPSASHGLFFIPLTAGLLAGVNAGRFWQRRWKRTRIMNATSFGLAVSVLALWLALQADWMNVPLLVIFLLCYGLLLGCSLPVQSTILVNLFQRQRGTAVGLYNSFRFIGAAIGPLIGGLIVIRYSVNFVFLTLAILLIVAAFVIRKNLFDPSEEAPR